MGLGAVLVSWIKKPVLLLSRVLDCVRGISLFGRLSVKVDIMTVHLVPGSRLLRVNLISLGFLSPLLFINRASPFKR